MTSKPTICSNAERAAVVQAAVAAVAASPLAGDLLVPRDGDEHRLGDALDRLLEVLAPGAFGEAECTHDCDDVFVDVPPHEGAPRHMRAVELSHKLEIARCYHCDEVCDRDDSHDTDDGWLCESCADDISTCSSCIGTGIGNPHAGTGCPSCRGTGRRIGGRFVRWDDI